MIDIVELTSEDIGFYDSSVPKAGNIFGAQIGDLEYLPDFGIDLVFFLSPDFEFENAAFKSYLVQRLSEYGIDVSAVIELIRELSLKYTFVVEGRDLNSGLIR